jgi:hypothetical protein
MRGSVSGRRVIATGDSGRPPSGRADVDVMGRSRRWVLAAALACGPALAPLPADAEPVPVRFKEGLVHGFLVLSTPVGERLADGDLIQTVDGDRVTSRLVFRFKDGSVHDETAVFSQRGTFQLISDHLVQKGKAFPREIDVTIDAASGQVAVRHKDEDGKEKTEADRLDLPPDLANGVILTLLKNLAPGTARASVSFLAATPKPRVVKLEITAGDEQPFSTGGKERKATRYRVHVDIGGLTGVLARLLGKQPEDSAVWILGGEAPAFVKSEGPLSAEGPSWRIELTSPRWPAAAANPWPVSVSARGTGAASTAPDEHDLVLDALDGLEVDPLQLAAGGVVREGVGAARVVDVVELHEEPDEAAFPARLRFRHADRPRVVVADRGLPVGGHLRDREDVAAVGSRPLPEEDGEVLRDGRRGTGDGRDGRHRRRQGSRPPRRPGERAGRAGETDGDPDPGAPPRCGARRRGRSSLPEALSHLGVGILPARPRTRTSAPASARS